MSKTALYPGSFDPITFGHLDIIERAAKCFGKVVIAMFNNPDKNPVFTFQERKMLIQQVLKDAPYEFEIDSFTGLLANYAKSKHINTIIRGLRAVSDFDYEFQMALMNRRLNHHVDTAFFMTDEKFSYLSSSLVKQVCRFQGDISSFVPPVVAKALKEKYE